MEMTRCLLLGFEASKAYLFLTLNELFLAVFMILVQSLTSNGVSALVIVVYEHVIATVLLSFLAFFLERSVLLSSLHVYGDYIFPTMHRFFFIFKKTKFNPKN